MHARGVPRKTMERGTSTVRAMDVRDRQCLTNEKYLRVDNSTSQLRVQWLVLMNCSTNRRRLVDIITAIYSFVGRCRFVGSVMAAN
jgi:hypothetical protein